MILPSGSRLGSYEIVSPLGAGGMGEVYRARDTKLGRDVAVKILPEALANDPDRVARFQREAQLLAAFNHPHIAAIYGLEESGASKFLVLELIEGESLAERLSRGDRPVAQPLPFGESLARTRQIVDALEAAHEKGIIHRDLKPGNIMLTQDGQVKVLDFGLAKALETEGAGSRGSGAGFTQSPTLSFAATQAGLILGTAGYMSPEQAKGRAADKRSDVWAFGCVLYEMLTGRRAFNGEDVTEIIADVVKGEPDWNAFPADVPPHIRTLVKRCLEKDRKARISDIGVVRYVMTEASAAHGEAPALPMPARRGRFLGIAGGVAGGAALAGLIAWAVIHWTPAPKLQPVRFAISLPATQQLAVGPGNRQIAFSPGGTHLAYIANTGAGQGVLMVRALDRLEAEPLRGITGVRAPFISPDGKWIGFFDGTGISKVSISGGPPIPLCRVQGGARGASWGEGDTIIFATSFTTTGLLAVSAAAGEPKVLTKPDTTHGEQDHLFPSVLPGGRAVLFTIIPSSGMIDNSQVAVLDLRTGKYKILVRGGNQAEYVETGHLVYAAAGTLRAVRFDPARLEVLSDPVPVVEQVMTKNSGAAEFSVSRNGALVFVPGSVSGGASLVWVDRKGHEEPIAAPPRAYNVPRLSPDGTRVALDIRDQEHDIWIWDLARGTLPRLTFDPGRDFSPVWTPDGRRIIFASTRAGEPNLFWQPADNTGTAERLTNSTNAQIPNSISHDGTRVVLSENVPNMRQDIKLLVMDGKGQTTPLVQTTYSEYNAEISPDGNWLAYQSNETGVAQIYVRPFPNVNSGHHQISNSGGTRPAWARSGRELFYLDAVGAMTVVPIQTTPNFRAGNPAKLFQTRYFTENIFRTYDVSRDGQRFLMIKDAGGDQTATPATMTVVLNWSEELKARAGK